MLTLRAPKGWVFNIRGGRDLTLHEVNIAAEAIYEEVDEDANIIFGAVIDDALQGEVHMTVIATGFTPQETGAPPSRKVSAPKPKPERPQPAPPKPDGSPAAVKPKPAKPSGTQLPKPGATLDIPDFLQRRRPDRS